MWKGKRRRLASGSSYAPLHNRIPVNFGPDVWPVWLDESLISGGRHAIQTAQPVAVGSAMDTSDTRAANVVTRTSRFAIAAIKWKARPYIRRSVLTSSGRFSECRMYAFLEAGRPASPVSALRRARISGMPSSATASPRASNRRERIARVHEFLGADVNRTARDSFISLDRAEQIAEPDYFGVEPVSP